MRLCYVLLSPTTGMHQYTADMANRMAAAGHRVSLVTTALLPRDRYAPEVTILAPVSTSNTGLSPQSLDWTGFRTVARTALAQRPDVVHFTGPHLWNPGLMRRLQQAGVPAIHTIHDLDPHHGRRFGPLLRPWNRAVLGSADKILVHGKVYERRLLEKGLPADRLAHTPLLHLFLSYEALQKLDGTNAGTLGPPPEPMLLFFGRLEVYKGVEYLLSAFAEIADSCQEEWRLVLAGPGDLSHVWTGSLPSKVELRNRLIGDDEALDLFRRCSLVVLPYVDATQSALVAAAYYFSKPVLVSRSGALPEYVLEGETGFVVEPAHPATLARTIAAAVDSPERLRRMGEAGRAWYERERAGETEQLLALYAAFG